MEKVVKCNRCGKYFMHTGKDIKCPFCHTAYVKVEEIAKEEKTKEKKEVTKTQKKTFKIWKDN